MASNRRLPFLLALLGLALVALVVSRGGFAGLDPLARFGTFAGRPAAPGSTGTAASTDEPAAPREQAFPDVNLEGLEAARSEPAAGGRNPFTLRATPRATPDGEGPQAPSTVESAPSMAQDTRQSTPMVAGVPPIPLKFIGIVNLPGDRGKLAVLSDGEFVYHGRQGDVVEGRYRIVSIGDESIELEHTDGRGRQSLMLTGS